MADRRRTVVRAREVIGFQHGEHRRLRDGVIVIEGDTIVDVGQDEPATYDQLVDLPEHLVSPGFISTHGHYATAPFDRGVREDWGNPLLYMSGLYEHAIVIGAGIRDPKTATLASTASILELVRSGVTTGVDLTSWPEATVDAASNVGFRAYVGPYFRSARWRTDGHEVRYEWLDAGAEAQGFERALDFVRDNATHGLVRGMLAPAQLDTCRPELLRRAQQVARAEGHLLQVHAAQSVVEYQEMIRRSGRSPVQFMADLGILGESTILAHCIFVGGHSWLSSPLPGDLELLAATGASVAHCPWVFARYGQGLESLEKYLGSGVRIAMGIDTVPQSMLAEMKVAATVAKFVDRSALVGTAREVFDAATLGGARALGRPDLGRIASGCKADLVVFRLATAQMSPMRDPIKNIVYSATPLDIDQVVIGGKTVMSAGKITTVDEQQIVSELRDAASSVWDRFAENDHAGRALDDLSPFSVRAWEPPEGAGRGGSDGSDG